MAYPDVDNFGHRKTPTERRAKIVATRKTTPASGTAKNHTTKAQSSSKTGNTSPKAEPEVLDPLKQSKSPQKKVTEPETIDAAVIEVKQPTSSPSQTSAKIKKTPEGPKQDAPQKPAARLTLMFSGLVLGGLVAGAIGYGAAIITASSPEIIPPDQASIPAEILSRFNQLETRISVLEQPKKSTELDKLRTTVAALKSSLESETNALSKRLLDTETKLKTALSATSNPTKTNDTNSADLVTSYSSEINQIKAQIADQQARSDELSARLDAVAKQAGAQLSEAKTKIENLSKSAKKVVQSLDLSVATERLRTAIETGRPFGDLLASIAAETKTTLPATLQINGQNGVATLSQLQKDFPEAARQALKSSIQADAGSGFGSKITAYVKSQIGVRSLEEKAGDGPDAVLSQAEASLGRGQLAQAIDLLQKLPPEGVASMGDWLTAANTSLAVRAALIKFEKTLENKN
ncbi:MAG: hypothetical protein GXP05_03155 [Alphaproteobacteria bacterium]|nr:hypothetical protein [Alphaproteobacteria bacterium]